MSVRLVGRKGTGTHVTAAVGHLLVDVVVAQNFVDCKLISDVFFFSKNEEELPFRSTPGMF